MNLSFCQRPSFTGLGILLLAAALTGCTARAAHLEISDLGTIGPPVPVRLAPTNQGGLRVYTDWIPVPAIDLDTHQRADYRILRADGTLYRTVSNAGSPAQVSLPAGAYLIDTSVAPYGPMRIPVRVSAEQTTEICLTGEWDAAFQRVPASAVIKLPDGRVIGWRAPQPATGPSSDATAR
jgi:hypothetical protein